MFSTINQNHKEDFEREKACISNIKKIVSDKCKISEFIDYDNSTVAFAGSKENMELILEVYTQKMSKIKYLCASLDDEVSWQECDFDTIQDFEENIAEYIANRVNKTVKTVIDAENNEFSVISYYLNENGEWICFEDDKSNSKLVCLISSKTVKSTETIKTYKLEI